MSSLVFAVLDTSSQFSDVCHARRARELTIAFTRFKYSGPILEDPDLSALLDRAAASEYRYCIVLPFGCLLSEVWKPEESEDHDVIDSILRWAASHDFLTATLPGSAPEKAPADSPGFLLVDLETYRESGIRRFGDPLQLPSVIADHVVTLDPTHNASWVNRESESGIESDTHADDFASGVEGLTKKLRRAVFVWNIESYADIEQPAPGFEPPLKALYTVSAGFKANRILQTHGCSEDTRMVVYDYSQKGLEFRQMLHEEWDGHDYPAFLRRLFRKLPPGDTHYLLWAGMSPENLDWDLVESRWQAELTAWGGSQSLSQHWQVFQKMRVEYLHCDLLTQQDRLLEQIRDEDGSLIWWSNAFFSLHSIWNYSAPERQEIYRRWIAGLADRAPRIFVYGSDCNNVSVNGHTAARIQEWLQSAPGHPLDELQPSGLNRLEMRY